MSDMSKPAKCGDTGNTANICEFEKPGNTGLTVDVGCNPGYYYYPWDRLSPQQLCDIANNNNPIGKYRFTQNAQAEIINFLVWNQYYTEDYLNTLSLDEYYAYIHDITFGCVKFRYTGKIYTYVEIPPLGAINFIWQYDNSAFDSKEIESLYYDCNNQNTYSLLSVGLKNFYDGLYNIFLNGNKGNITNARQSFLNATIPSSSTSTDKVFTVNYLMSLCMSFAKQRDMFELTKIPFYDYMIHDNAYIRDYVYNQDDTLKDGVFVLQLIANFLK